MDYLHLAGECGDRATVGFVAADEGGAWEDVCCSCRTSILARL